MTSLVFSISEANRILAKTEASVMIDRPVEAVWKFITDLSNAPNWDKGLTECKQTSDGPIELGSTFVAIHPRLTYSERVSEYEPNRKLSLEMTSGPAKGTVGTFRMESIEGKTELTESDDYRFSGFYKLVGPFLIRTAKRETASRVVNVKRILESEGTPKAGLHS